MSFVKRPFYSFTELFLYQKEGKRYEKRFNRISIYFRS